MEQTKPTTPMNSKENTRASKSEIIEASVIMAFKRTGQDVNNLERITKDILEEFNRMNPQEIVKAIKNGSLGMYGRTYKLSTQEVCIWVREYLKSKNNKGI